MTPGSCIKMKWDRELNKVVGDPKVLLVPALVGIFFLVLFIVALANDAGSSSTSATLAVGSFIGMLLSVYSLLLFRYSVQQVHWATQLTKKIGSANTNDDPVFHKVVSSDYDDSNTSSRLQSKQKQRKHKHKQRQEEQVEKTRSNPIISDIEAQRRRMLTSSTSSMLSIINEMDEESSDEKEAQQTRRNTTHMRHHGRGDDDGAGVASRDSETRYYAGDGDGNGDASSEKQVLTQELRNEVSSLRNALNVRMCNLYILLYSVMLSLCKYALCIYICICVNLKANEAKRGRNEG